MARMPVLQLDPLRNASDRLREAMATYEQDRSEYLRDSVIKRFEFIYEVSVRLLKRVLDLAAPTAGMVDQMSFPELIRTADEQGLLLSGWPRWKEFRNARNRSSHAYSEELAREVLSEIPSFQPEADFLYQKLSERTRHLNA